MPRLFLFLPIALPALLVSAFAQTGPLLVNASYTRPILNVAPGQIVTLQVAGLKTILPCADPTCVTERIQQSPAPLPTMLAGISVTIKQYYQQFLAFPYVFRGSYQLPIISIRQVFVCDTTSTALTSNPNPAPTTPECYMAFLTVQIPFELLFNAPANPSVGTEVVISENGTDSQPFSVNVVPDHIHVVTTCDNARGQSTCQSIVAHADGTLVTSNSPAVLGETVVIYAWGLGSTSPRVKTGAVTPEPAPVVAIFGSSPSSPKGPGVRFDFSPNAALSAASDTGTLTAPAYLTPEQIGLYQVNVQLPATFPAVPTCGPNVQSNLTINLSGALSSDGAAICVQPTK